MAERLVRYRWNVAVVEVAAPGAPFRALERIIRQGIGPATSDPVFQEHAVAFAVSKTAEPTAEDRVRGWVDLTAVAPSDSPIRGAVQRHLGDLGAIEEPPSDADPLLLPQAAEYRRGLTDMVAIALDLHGADPTTLRAHQGELLQVACSATDPRFQLHPYLSEHSKVYRARTGVPPDGSSWSWEHEECWARFYTPGPMATLAAPIYALLNVVLGIVPRRWDRPDALAARIDIPLP